MASDDFRKETYDSSLNKTEKENPSVKWRSVAKGEKLSDIRQREAFVSSEQPEKQEVKAPVQQPVQTPQRVEPSSEQKQEANTPPFFNQDASSQQINFGGKSAERGFFAKENLEGTNFSASNLEGVDFSGANLKYADFSGANLAHANLSGADLTGAVLTGASLKEANFTGAKLKGVKLHEADIQDAILLDIEIDDLGLEELQELVEYIAKYYPHKLNLSRLNLTLLDLSKIDLTKVSLRGVDFTGVSFAGVNVFELDLSECIITPEQIAQALGRVPSPEELSKILAPKPKEGAKFKGIDFDDLFFDNGRQFGVWDATRAKGVSIEKILSVGKKLFRSSAEKPPLKEQEIIDKIQRNKESVEKNHNRELRDLIEERKRTELEARKEKKKEVEREVDHSKDSLRERINDNMIRSRGTNER